MANVVDVEITVNSDKARNNVNAFEDQMLRLKMRFGEVDLAIRQNKEELAAYEKLQKQNMETLKNLQKAYDINLKQHGAEAQATETSWVKLQGLLRAMRNNAVAMQELSAMTKELTTEQKILAGQMDYLSERHVQLGTNIKGLRLELSNLQNQYHTLSDKEKETAAGQQLKTHIQELSDKITEQEKAIRQYYGNIGNYPKIIESMNPAFQGIINSLYRVGLASRDARANLQIFTMRSMQDIKRLGQAFISGPFGMLAVVLGALVVTFELVRKAIGRNQETLDKLAVAGRRLQPVLTAIGDVFLFIGKCAAYALDFLAFLAAGFSDAADSAGNLQERLNALETAETEYLERTAALTAKLSTLRADATESDKNSLEGRVRALQEAMEIEEELAQRGIELAQERLRVMQIQAQNEHDTSLKTREEIAKLAMEYANKVSALETQRKRMISSMNALRKEQEKEEEDAYQRMKKRNEEELKNENDLAQSRVAAMRANFSENFRIQQQMAKQMFKVMQKIRQEEEFNNINAQRAAFNTYFALQTQNATHIKEKAREEIKAIQERRAQLTNEIKKDIEVSTDIAETLSKAVAETEGYKRNIYGVGELRDDEKNIIITRKEFMIGNLTLMLEDFKDWDEKYKKIFIEHIGMYKAKNAELNKEEAEQRKREKEGYEKSVKAEGEYLANERHLAILRLQLREKLGLNEKEFANKQASERVKFDKQQFDKVIGAAKAETEEEEAVIRAKYVAYREIAKQGYDDLLKEYNTFAKNNKGLGLSAAIGVSDEELAELIGRLSTITVTYEDLGDKVRNESDRIVAHYKSNSEVMRRLGVEEAYQLANARLQGLQRERQYITTFIQDTYQHALDEEHTRNIDSANEIARERLDLAIDMLLDEKKMRMDNDLEYYDVDQRLRKAQAERAEYYMNLELQNEQATIQEKLKAQMDYYEEMQKIYINDADMQEKIQQDSIKARAAASKAQLALDLKNLDNGIIGRRKAEERNIANLREFYKDNADMQIELDRMNYESLMKMFSEIGANIKEYTDASMEYVNQLDAFATQRNEERMAAMEAQNEREKESNNAKYQENSITYEQYQKKNAQLDKDLAKEKKKIEIEEAERKKAIGLVQAIINTSEAVTKALTSGPPPMSIALAAIQAAAGAVQIATVASQKIPKAATGGLIGGKPHSLGGTMIEAEKGEMIINKRATAEFLPLLAAINKYGSGVPFINEGSDGGFAERVNNPSPTVSTTGIAEAVSEAVSQMRIYTTVEDYRRADANYTEIESFGNI